DKLVTGVQTCALPIFTIALLVVLEGLLSADNALVLAIMILGLRRVDQNRALRYGLVGAFAFRIAATLLATHLIRVEWVKLLGARSEERRVGKEVSCGW